MENVKTIFGMIALSVVLAAGARAEVPAAVRDTLKEVQKYDMTQTRKPHIELDDFAHRADAAQKKELAGMLVQALADGQTTDVAKTLICQLLALVGTDAEVPALAKLLDDEKHGQDARYALHAMALPAADEALRTSLSRLKGKLLIGVVNSLGVRGDDNAVPELEKLLKDGDAGVADAAARALGNIGTKKAAGVLLKVPCTANEDARLRCAGKLAAAGEMSMAAELCMEMTGAGQKATVRVAALGRLSSMGAKDALPLLLSAMDDKNTFVSTSAMRFAGGMKGSDVTGALVGKLKSMDAPRQVLLLDVLAARGDGAARLEVEALTSSTNEDVRAAALAALGFIGNTESIKVLLSAAQTDGAAKTAAELGLATLKGADVDKAVCAGIGAGAVPSRVVMIGAAAARSMKAAVPELMAAVRDQDGKVQVAAAQALSKVADADAYPRMVDLLVESGNPGVRDSMRAAVASLSRRITEPKDRLAPLAAALQKNGISSEATAAVLKTMGSIGCPEGLVLVREKLGLQDPAVVDAAVRALADWQDASAVEDLIKVAETSGNNVHKTLALRGVMRLAPENGGQAMKWLARVKPLAKEKNQKQQLLAALGELKNISAMEMAVEMLPDNDVVAEAGMAAVNIGREIVKTQADGVDGAMTRVLAVLKDGPVAGNAGEVQAIARKILAKKTAGSKAVKEKRARALPQGSRLLTYLDCGVDSSDKSDDGVRLVVVKGEDYDWKDDDTPEDASASSVAYSGGEVVCEATGLNSQKAYQLGFTWWDYDGNDREESVWVNGTRLVDKTKLPAWKGKKEKPQTIVKAIPSDLVRDGKLKIEFKQEGSGNCVVSEIWLIEGAFAAASAVPQLMQDKPAAPGQKKILYVTGCDYPGHPWKLIEPVLRDAVGKDARLHVTVVEDPKYLASPDLKTYDVILLNYMNWQNPGPGAEAQEGLRKAVEGGTGLVMVHFTCGAFQTWPEFLKVAGRVWNPKFRGHDPRGEFKVEVVDKAHPIMTGMEDFQTFDELYSCLDGNEPIHVIAKATSKVDKKDYPMAYTHEYGKGKVFMSVLGHDVKAFEAEGVKKLFRHACAWAAGLEPQE